MIRPIKLGNLLLPSNIVYSPLAGCSDFPFRQMSNLFRPGLFFCEMIKMEALVRHDEGTYRILDYSHNMHPIGAQLCGSNPKIVRDAARIIEDLGFDVLDFNCGCPVDKVTKDGSGSGMLKSPELIAEMLQIMVEAVKIPVTIKIRIGWDENSIVGPQITKMAEEIGAKAVFVHGRTREQRYTGLANRDVIRACVEAKKEMPVFGNGDIFCVDSAEDMFQRTGCDGILVSRGTLGAPWIIETIKRNPEFELSDDYIYEMVREHYKYIRSYQDTQRVIVDMRKIGCWYLKNHPCASRLRECLNKAKTLADVENSLLAAF